MCLPPLPHAAPHPWPALAWLLQEQGHSALGLVAAGDTKGAAWPRKQILQCCISCNMSLVYWGVEGPEPQQRLTGWGRGRG